MTYTPKPKKLRCAARYSHPHANGRTTCGFWAREGSVYCQKHGSAEGHTNTEEHTAAIREGTRRYWAKLREALQKGLIDEFPNAAVKRETVAKAREVYQAQRREVHAIAAEIVKKKPGRPKGTPMAKSHKAAISEAKKLAAQQVRERAVAEAEAKAAQPLTVRRARNVLLHEKAQLPAPPDIPFEQMEPHEKLQVLTGMSLDFHHKVLSLPFDPAAQPKLAQMQMAAASGALALRVKVDRNALTARKVDGMVSLLERLKGERQGITIDG
jgi:hypothetical protein